MEGGMQTGGGAAAQQFAPPVANGGNFEDWVQPHPDSDDGSTAALMGGAMTSDDWWLDGSDPGSWTPPSHEESDSDSDSRYDYTSDSNLGLGSGSGSEMDGMGVPRSSGSLNGSDLGMMDADGRSGGGDADGRSGGGGSGSGSGSDDSAWLTASSNWLTMPPDGTESLSSGEYDQRAAPPIRHDVQVQGCGGGGGWGDGADFMTNPAANPAANPNPAVRRAPSPPVDRQEAKRPRAAAPSAARQVMAPIPEQATSSRVSHGSGGGGGASRVPVGTSMRWDEALYLLDQGAIAVRPSRLKLMPGAPQHIFLERPAIKRKKGDDKWVGSGGRKGSTEYWTNDHVGVRKRYGRVTCEGDGATPLKYAHYTRLRRVQPKFEGGGGGAARHDEQSEGHVIEDKDVALFVAIPATLTGGPTRSPPGGAASMAAASAVPAAAAQSIPLPLPTSGASGGGIPREPASAPGKRPVRAALWEPAAAPAATSGASAAGAIAPPSKRARGQPKAKPARVVPAPHIFTAGDGGASREDGLPAALTVQAGPLGRFISFRDAGGTGADKDRELGAFVRHINGVKLVSSQGDFAEWHRRQEGEAPFESGDVVCFRHGVISRVIHPRATMLGVISRMAVVEGSLPARHERHLFDTVA